MEDKYYQIYNVALKTYISNLNKLIEQYKNANRKCIMFSTNIIAEMTIHYLKKTSLAIEFIIDNSESKQGMIVYGKKVYSPDILREKFDESYIILIASSYQNEMINQLEQYGYKLNEQIIKIIDLPELMNDYSHVNRDGMKELTREEIKECQVGILRKLKEYSKKYGLKYYLSSGTTLGAVRHHGYIPWDDDVDVFIPIKDFLKLMNLLESDRRYKIVSQYNTNYYFGWGFGYMVDCETVCDINKFPIQLSTGQSIDIFPLYGIPSDEMEQEKYLKDVKELESQCIVASFDDGKRKNAIKEFNKYLLKYDYDECTLVGNVLMPAYTKDIFDKNIFGEGIEMEFEGVMLNLPQMYDSYLRKMYGDYMELPPEDKRVGEHFFNTYRVNAEERIKHNN